ncbi:MAG: hypothetical protein ACT4QB_00030 [Gammaproteobacteria bacterium]
MQGRGARDLICGGAGDDRLFTLTLLRLAGERDSDPLPCGAGEGQGGGKGAAARNGPGQRV